MICLCWVVHLGCNGEDMLIEMSAMRPAAGRGAARSATSANHEGCRLHAVIRQDLRGCQADNGIHRGREGSNAGLEGQAEVAGGLQDRQGAACGARGASEEEAKHVFQHLG